VWGVLERPRTVFQIINFKSKLKNYGYFTKPYGKLDIAQLLTENHQNNGKMIVYSFLSA